LILSGRGNRRPLQIGFDDIASYEVIANEATILQIGRREEDVFDIEAEHRLRAMMGDLQDEQMGPEATRQIDLRISGLPESEFISTVNFYYREGNRRLTPHSYTETVEDVVKWCGLLSSAIHPGVAEPAASESNAETVAALHHEAAPDAVPESPLPVTSKEENPVTDEPAERTTAEERGSSSEKCSVVDELTKLVTLKKQGYLSDEEFERAKAKIING
jgi:hypothetical protein